MPQEESWNWNVEVLRLTLRKRIIDSFSSSQIFRTGNMNLLFRAKLESLDGDVLCEGGYYTPSPLKNYFFLLCHMSRHFSEFESIRLRHILDWGLFLKAGAGGLDLQMVRRKLQEFGLERTNDLFVSLAEKVCGLDFSDLLFNRLPEAECSTVLEYILSDKQRVIPEHFVPRFLYKLKTLAGNNWKFRYLAITMRERVWYSVKWHLIGKAEILVALI